MKIVTKASEKNAIIINVHASMVSGNRDIDLSKLGVDVDKLPKGSRKVWKEEIYPTHFLKRYIDLKREAKVALTKWGSECEMGYFHTRKKAVEVLEKLEKIEVTWQEYVVEDALRFDLIKQERIDELEASAKADELSQVDITLLLAEVEKLQPAWGEIEGKFEFKKTCNPIVLDSSEFDTDFFKAQQNCVETIYESVMGSLIREVCSASAGILKSMLKMEASKGNPADYRVHHRSHAKLVDLTDKLYELSFIHKNVQELHKEIAIFVDQFSGSFGTALRGAQYQVFKLAILALSDQHEVAAKIRTAQPFLSTLTAQSIRKDNEEVVSVTVQVKPQADDDELDAVVVDDEVADDVSDQSDTNSVHSQQWF